MQTTTLVARSVAHYWRTNLAVVAGVATAVAVLAGALLVGESVKESLRELVLGRIGKTDFVVAGTNFFRSELRLGQARVYPMIALEGIVTANQRTAAKVAIYGVDDGFWKFHDVFLSGEAPAGRTARLSPALAEELAVASNDSLVVRLGQPSEIPAESLHGRKEDLVRTVRLSAGKTLTTAELGEFALRPSQGSVRAIFVSLERLQRELKQENRANLLLVNSTASRAQIESALRRQVTLDDLGIRVKPTGEQLSLETASMVLNDALLEAGKAAAKDVGLTAKPVLTYLVNALRIGNRTVPYSLVTAIDLGFPVQGGIVLNEWAARELQVKPGDRVELEYYVWRQEGHIATERTTLTAGGVIPIQGPAADRDYAPEYPGITESKTIHDWDPPFPMDLGRIRKQDEDYWDKYRTTPKAFVSLAEGQKLWTTRFGSATSLRLIPKTAVDPVTAQEQYQEALRRHLDPFSAGMMLVPVREEGLTASQGSTDFGQYFTYFSFFLMISALLLVGLFFRLGVEQRYREAGLLRAVGYPMALLRQLFVREGLLLAGAGALLGMLAAGVYAALILHGLRTWWVDAVGTTLLSLHLSGQGLVGGAIGGLIASLVAILLAVRALRKPSPRALLQGSVAPDVTAGNLRRARLTLAIAAVTGIALLGAAVAGVMPPVGGFFGAGALLLIASLAAIRVWIGNGVAEPVTVWRLGLRNASYRPGRSVLSMSLIASATFLILALTAFRQEGASLDPAKHPGTGGFGYIGESVLPVIHNPATKEGREEIGIDAEGQVVALRLRPGDDSSCLNLYAPRNPRVVGIPPEAWKRFPFSESAPIREGFPVWVDANSLQYVLHKSVGDVIELDGTRLRIVGTLRDSIFQSELVMREQDFIRAFPGQQGFRMFLVDAGQADLALQMEDRLKDFGLDMRTTVDRLSEFHRVENAYLSTFQALGGLGLILGTVGLAAVLLRNVLERRKELALLRAVGYQPRQIGRMVLAENVLLLVCGLAAGVLCALLAIAPALAERGGSLPLLSMLGMLVLVFAAGLLASAGAVRAALGSPLLEALRAE